MRAATLRIMLVVLLVLAFTVAFTSAVLTGTSAGAGIVVGLLLVVALCLVSIVGSLVMTTTTQEVSTTVAAPRQRVFDMICDPRHLFRWNPTLVGVDLVSGEPGMVGSVWRARMANGIVFENELIAAEPPSRLVISARIVITNRFRRTTSSVTERTLEATPAGTELRARRTLRTPLIAWAIMRLRRASDQRMASWIDERMREVIESAEADPARQG